MLGYVDMSPSLLPCCCIILVQNLIPQRRFIIRRKAKLAFSNKINWNISQKGVEKLAEAQNLVKELRIDAEQQQNILEEKQAKANASLNMISDTMRGANTQKEEMENLKFNIQEESIKLTER